MTLLAANFQKIIDEYNARNKKGKKKKKKKIITISKFNPETGKEEMIEIETPDSGTFEEMFKRYGNDYRYFCAMFPLKPMPKWRLLGGNKWKPFKLFPDRKKAEEEIDKNPDEYPYSTVIREEILDYNRHLNPLRYYSDHTAWIDLETSCILVEKAP